jgi:hypothetical protein
MATTKKLTDKQLACLRHFVHKGEDYGWSFGAGTLTSLRKLGLLEKFKNDSEYTMWRATEIGRAACGTGADL